MRGISKSLIESIANSDYAEFAENTEAKVSTLVSLAVEDMAFSIPFVSTQKCILQPVNETFNGAVTAESEFMYFLGFDSPQIEINCLQYNDWWKKFKDRVIFAWNNSKKKRKKKRKKGQKQEQMPQYEFDTEKYNIDSLKDDLQKAFVKNLTTTSIVYNQDRCLRVIGRDEFGPKTQIFIYPCLYDSSDGTYKFLISRKKGFYKINFTKRAELINQKIDAVGVNFIKMLKILNTLFRTSSKYSYAPNQIFLESLLYGVPDEFYVGDSIYDVFIKIVNYLNLTDVSNFKSILNPEITISQDKATKSNQIAFTRFLNSLNDINKQINWFLCKILCYEKIT